MPQSRINPGAIFVPKILKLLYLVSLRNGVLTCFTGGGTGNVLVVMSSVEGKHESFLSLVIIILCVFK